MDSLCGKLLTSILILPITAGNYRRRRNGSWYYDCTLSFRVLFLGFIALIIVFSATKSIHTNADVRLGIVLLLLSVLILGGIAVCFIFVWLAHTRGVGYLVATRRPTNISKLQVRFLCVFGVASGLFTAFYVGKLIECSVHTTGGLYWSSIMCFNLLLVISFLAEMIFITYFSTYKLKHSTIVNYSMLLLLAAIVCVQIYITIIGDSFSTFIEINNANATVSCLQSNSTMTFLIDKSRSVLTPMFMEFALLSSTVIFEIWSPFKVNRNDNEALNSDVNAIQDYERTPLLPHASAMEPENSGIGNGRKLSQMMTIIVSLITGFGLVIVYAAMAMNFGNITTLHYVAEYYELILKVLMIVASLVGFFCLVNHCTPDSSTKPLQIRENVYLLSVFGVIMVHICKVILGNVSPYSTSKIILYTNMLSIFQDYLQVVFLLHANRCKKSDPRSNVVLLESVLLFTTLINFVLWVNDTFLLSQYPITQVMTTKEFSTGVLRLGYTVLLPVSIFYRFTSFLQYFATFRDYAS